MAWTIVLSFPSVVPKLLPSLAKPLKPSRYQLITIKILITIYSLIIIILNIIECPLSLPINKRP
jgi:hypothetical protein